MQISIIIPTLNEATTIGQALNALAHWRAVSQIIVADGGSTDQTVALARQANAQIVQAARGRGTQMNAGAAVATGDVLLFLHADTHLPDDALRQIEQAMADPARVGGNFSLRFSGTSHSARWLTRIYPCLRWGGMCYGDSAMFVRRAVFVALGGYREYPIFEDVDLFRRLKRRGQFHRLPAVATTSARRFEGRFGRTLTIWVVMQVLYWLGVAPARLARLYPVIR